MNKQHRRYNVLYLSYDGLTDPLGQSQVLPYILGLEECGYNFTVITFEKRINYKANRQEVLTILKDKNITWVPLTYHKSPPVFSTLYDIFKLYRTVNKVLISGEIGIIHCRSYITSIIGVRMKKKYGSKFIFDMRGFFADERVQGNIWNLMNPVYYTVYNYFKRKEIQFLKEADYIISLTEAGKGIIESWHVKKEIPIKVIPCCTDLQLFNLNNIDMNKVEEKRKQLGLKENNFVFTYVGSLGTWYMLDEMLDFFNRVLLKDENARFLFITKDDPMPIKEKIMARGIPENSILITPATRKEVPLYLKAGDVAIFFIQPVFSKKASSPTKQGELMALGIPLICNAGIGDVDEIVEKYKAGLIVSEFSNQSYDAVVSRLEDLKKLDPDNIIKGAEKFYDLKMGVQKYKEVYSTLFDETSL